MGEFTRRTFLKSVGLGAGAFVLSSKLVPRRGTAADQSRNFIFCYFSGGWDTLLCLDPRDPATFTDDRADETRIELGWSKIPATFPRAILQPAGSNIAFGPAVGPFSQHFDKSCVVRGISMDTVTHEVGRRYFITGKTPRGLTATGSSMPTRIVAQQGARAPVPNLVARVESYNDGLAPFATGLAINSVTDLQLALTDGGQAPRDAARRRLDEYRAGYAACDPALHDQKGMLSLILETQKGARTLVTGGYDQRFRFTNATDPEMMALRARYAITNNLISSGAQAAMAFQALKYGIAQSVSIALAEGLDTHDSSWEDDHPNTLLAAFTALAQLVTDLAAEPHPMGGSLLDRTTILCFSEFGRTALINSRGGRDHSLSSSCLLVGAGVPHNKVIGASSDLGMNPMPVDPMSGAALQSGGVTISPTLVLASLMKSAGMDTTELRADGLPCLVA